MEKDFDGWNMEKRRIQGSESQKLYHQREIWWCSLGVNIGSEQDGTGVDHQRPVLILKGMSRSTCYVVPLTTSSQKHKLRIPIGSVEDRQATALISQIRLIDTKRLVNKVGFLDLTSFAAVKKAAKALL
jgi:mRNA-degrading endonuclease toxin of MazEF toxin-antitoxin module